jgi:putative membrane protein
MPAARIVRFAIVAFAFCSLAAPFASAQKTAALTDPQIANIAYTAGVLDIANARLALKKSHNRAILAFARDMIRDHTAVNRKALALVRKLHITPQNNPTSQALVKESDQVRAQLASLSGPAFDKAYIQNEVAYHKTVNSALKTELIPDARNPQLKRLLETGLKIFEGHERHAEMIADRMK